MSGSSPDYAFSKDWMSLNPGAFLRTIYKSDKITPSDVTIQCLKVHSQQRIWNKREVDETFLFAQMLGAWSKELASHTHIGVWTSRTLQIHEHPSLWMFSHIAAFCHTQATNPEYPSLSLLFILSAQGSHIASLPQLSPQWQSQTVTTLKHQPNSCSSLQQINCLCWCSLQAEHSHSLLHILLVHRSSPESSLAIPAETPGSMNCHFLFSSVLQGVTLTFKNHSASPAWPVYNSCEQELWKNLAGLGPTWWALQEVTSVLPQHCKSKKIPEVSKPSIPALFRSSKFIQK